MIAVCELIFVLNEYKPSKLGRKYFNNILTFCNENLVIIFISLSYKYYIKFTGKISIGFGIMVAHKTK